MDVDPFFGAWFAGLADGRAMFMISYVSGPAVRHPVQPRCRFQLMLRSDDRPVLQQIRERLGIGRLTVIEYTGKHQAHSDQVRLTIHRAEDCLQLVALLRCYPLRTSKGRQFEVWARAVEEVAKGEARSDAVVAALRDELQRLRLDGAESAEPQRVEPLSAGPDGDEPPTCLCGCGRPTRLIANQTARPHPENPDYCSFLRGHYHPDERRPRCLCGCGQMTSRLRNPASRPHPDDPNYCAFMRSHQNPRLRASSGRRAVTSYRRR
jgi:hypothetical protein